MKAVQLTEEEYNELQEAKKTHDGVGWCFGIIFFALAFWGVTRWEAPKNAIKHDPVTTGQLCAVNTDCLNSVFNERRRLGF